MTPLEDELVDLGAHLAHGDGDDLAALVRARLDGPQRRPSGAGLPLWAKVAAAVVLALGLALALPPSRRAIARWFGVGAVQIRTVPTTVLGMGTTASPASTVPGSVDATSTAPVAPPAAADVASAQAQVTFPIRLPTDAAAGPLRRIDVDDRVPGGLVVLVYDRFTIVELASAPNAFPVMVKLAPPGVTVDSTDVASDFAVWVGGAHEIAYQSPDGSIRQDTVRRAGSVLVWTRDNVTLRLEGLGDLDTARRIAASVR